MSCKNQDLGVGLIDLFPLDPVGRDAIHLFVERETGALHIHQGRDCVVLAHHLADDFADHISRAAGIEYARADE